MGSGIGEAFRVAGLAARRFVHLCPGGAYVALAGRDDRLTQYQLRRPGQIVLARDVGAATAWWRCDPSEMFTGLRQRGFRFITVSELLACARARDAFP